VPLVAKKTQENSDFILGINLSPVLWFPKECNKTELQD
jgi:hypothetical protein